MAGLQDIAPIVEIRWVIIKVRAPILAAAAVDPRSLFESQSGLLQFLSIAGSYDATACAEIYGQYLKGTTTDYMLELNQKDKERIFDLGYYTWVEQQGVDINHFEARRNQNFWEQHLKNMLDLDDEIDKFNTL